MMRAEAGAALVAVVEKRAAKRGWRRRGEYGREGGGREEETAA